MLAVVCMQELARPDLHFATSRPLSHLLLAPCHSLVANQLVTMEGTVGLQIIEVGVLYLVALFDQEIGASPQDHSLQMCGQTWMRIFVDLVAGLCNLKDRDNNSKALLVS